MSPLSSARRRGKPACAKRRPRAELAELILAGQIAGATARGRIVGSVRLQQVSDDTGEFGMLVAAPAHCSTGVGRALVDFAAHTSRDRGLHTMQLEVLVPREWTHPSKEFLKAWYRRVGYRLVRTGGLEDAYPDLAPLLATPCNFEIYEKPLAVSAVAEFRR
jgi:ribosomal protein S18 acetylase RimI-like enzyme